MCVGILPFNIHFAWRTRRFHKLYPMEKVFSESNLLKLVDLYNFRGNSRWSITCEIQNRKIQTIPNMHHFSNHLDSLKKGTWQHNYTMDPRQLNSSQQFCQSINTFLNKCLSKAFLGQRIFGRKKLKKHIDYALCIIIHNYTSIYILHARDVILHIQQCIIIIKVHVTFQPDWLKIFRNLHVTDNILND